MNVLVVNAGSSSLKYQLFDTEKNEVKAKGLCERIGIGGKIIHKVPGKEDYAAEIEMKNHADATRILVETLTDKKVGCISDMKEIEAVGHRVVHGGSYFTKSVLLNKDVLEKLELCKELAPLHTPPTLMGIQGCLEAMPEVPQVLVFDTAFHQTMPKEAYTYPIPYEYYEKYGVRKYGFHGTSHRYVSAEMIKLLDKPASETKIVTCHLGNGSSISAVKGGKVVDTTMGFTPLDGVIMGTRSGNIDPAVVTFLMEKENLSVSQVNDILNKKSGFLGVSGISSDCRDICAAIENGDERAKLALDILGYQIKKYIGAYSAAMGGLDAIVFTAGIGENTPIIREMACEGLEYLGVELDKNVNDNVPRPIETTCLSTKDSKVKIYLIPTNEELVIANDTADIVSNK
ncbi:MAG: acetate kinase [Ruminococcaceae bacterium]|nr:acetate kinase [Oscillospiraceae bacterium]